MLTDGRVFKSSPVHADDRHQQLQTSNMLSFKSKVHVPQYETTPCPLVLSHSHVESSLGSIADFVQMVALEKTSGHLRNTETLTDVVEISVNTELWTDELRNIFSVS